MQWENEKAVCQAPYRSLSDVQLGTQCAVLVAFSPTLRGHTRTHRARAAKMDAQGSSTYPAREPCYAPLRGPTRHSRSLAFQRMPETLHETLSYINRILLRDIDNYSLLI